MTFKSIATILAECEEAKILRRFTPVMDEDECEKRRLYLSREIHARLYEYPKAERDYWANVRDSLGTYVKGDPIADDEKLFKRLDPKGDESLKDIWEIRILFSPQSRLFGAFIGEDSFVAFTSRLRENCPFSQRECGLSAIDGQQSLAATSAIDVSR